MSVLGGRKGDVSRAQKAREYKESRTPTLPVCAHSGLLALLEPEGDVRGVLPSARRKLCNTDCSPTEARLPTGRRGPTRTS